ncbi:pyridoxal-5'-phosphate-dependent protein subunit beta [Bosea sp. Root483D1]|uniref:threonine synthase n=1 Tax=Bosea sp. Root483D1 TaxID=1736544 RepID=UPI000710864A|nr:pyridoxal-phosphate dependent enzyme [Bosea sp. Root483D1]KRE11579.1 pyridoxal-5'-phosphate-dependent protein subunit beta [Bosea sp. Root483D1]
MQHDRRTPAYLDPESGEAFSIAEPRWRSPAGRALMITPLPGMARDEIDTSRRSLWRYGASLALPVDAPITLGEGLTPLVERDLGGLRVLCKLEWVSPSGSFKDRGVSVMLSVLRQQGVMAVLEDSSGNGGAAVATYAAAGGMRAKILVPASTQPGKTVQMRAHGAEVELVEGPRQATADEAIRQSHRLFYASHNWQAFFLEGTKTLAYELWEDLGFRAPNNVIMPMGAGSNVLGCDIGFGELLRAGQITKLPRLFGVQPARCAPIHASFQAGSERAVAIETGPTIAEGTAIAQPVRLREVLQALRRSRGGTVALSEEAIEQAVWQSAEAGLYVEPTSAGVIGAFRQLQANGDILPGETTILVLTGSGLKATSRISELMEGARKQYA